MKTHQLLRGAMALTVTVSLAGCQRSTAQADAKQAATDAKQSATNVASDIKASTQKAAAKAGDELSDVWISTKIQSKFVADHDINARDIRVSSQDGVVTLKGLIQNEPMRSLAVSVAKNTDGVKQIVDQLTVTVASPVASPIAPPRGVAVATSGVADEAADSGAATGDGRITSSIQSKYFLDDKLKGRQIQVDTNNGVVTLRGNVGSETEHREALLLARTSEGVKRVEDDLTITAGQP